MRASKLISMAGSEIIVPNGDLLSGHVINWTLSNNHMRVSLDLNLVAAIGLEHAKQLISDEILANRNTLPQVVPEILLRGVNGQMYELQVLFWISNSRHEQQLKSEILAGIHKRFGEEGILINVSASLPRPGSCRPPRRIGNLAQPRARPVAPAGMPVHSNRLTESE